MKCNCADSNGISACGCYALTTTRIAEDRHLDAAFKQLIEYVPAPDDSGPDDSRYVRPRVTYITLRQ